MGELFWEKGYKGTRLMDIAKARCNRPSEIYNLFPKKEALRYEVLLNDLEYVVNPNLLIELAHNQAARAVAAADCEGEK